MPPRFRAGARTGFRAFFPQTAGLVPWALATGMAMVNVGLTPLQAMAMNVVVFNGTVQLAALPLIVAGVPLGVTMATALALNLRFVIFSAAIADGFRGVSTPTRWLAAHLLSNGVFAVCLDKMLATSDRQWRLGYYLAPAVLSWVVWQTFSLIGVLAAGEIPRTWSLEFIATIALIALLRPMANSWPTRVAAVTGGALAVALHGLPLKLGVIMAILAGIGAGSAAEGWQTRALARVAGRCRGRPSS